MRSPTASAAQWLRVPGGQIACTVNEDNRNGGGNPASANLIGQGATYGGVPDGEQSQNIFFPQIVPWAPTASTAVSRLRTQRQRRRLAPIRSRTVMSSLMCRWLRVVAANSVFAETVLTANKTNLNGSVKVQCGQPIVGIYNLSMSGRGPLATRMRQTMVSISNG